MKQAFPADIALTCLLALLTTGIGGCSPMIAPSPLAGATVAAPANPPDSKPEVGPTSEPAGDWFNVDGFVPQYGILIDSVEEDETQISITWWSCGSDGFLQGNYISSSKAVLGRAKPIVFRASPDEQRMVIADWQRRGYAARTTGLDGATSEVSNVFVLYNPPAGYQWVPPGGNWHETVFRILVDGAEQEIDFGSISDYTLEENQAGLTLHNGDKLAGTYLPPTYNSKPFEVQLVGFQVGADGRLSKFDVPFDSVRSLVFLASPDPDSK